jgi:hypothetical protein
MLRAGFRPTAPSGLPRRTVRALVISAVLVGITTPAPGFVPGAYAATASSTTTTTRPGGTSPQPPARTSPSSGTTPSSGTAPTVPPDNGPPNNSPPGNGPPSNSPPSNSPPSSSAPAGTLTATYSGSFSYDITNPQYLPAYEASRSQTFAWSESVTIRIPECALTSDPGCFNEDSDGSSETADVVGAPTLTVSGKSTSTKAWNAPPDIDDTCSATASAGPVSAGQGSPIRVYFALQQVQVYAVGPATALWTKSTSTNPWCAFGGQVDAPIFWQFQPVPDVDKTLPYSKTYTVPANREGRTGSATFTVTGAAQPCPTCPCAAGTVDDAAGGLTTAAVAPVPALTQGPRGGQLRATAERNLTPMASGGSCVSIWWMNSPQGAMDVTGKRNLPVIVGQQISLEARFRGQKATASNKVKWTLQGPVVANYTVGDTSAAVEQLPATSLAQADLSFYWYRAGFAPYGPGEAHSVSEPLQVTVNGKRLTVSFEVKSPGWDLSAQTCGAGVDTDISQGVLLPAFGLGRNQKCPLPGIIWTAHVTGLPGEFALTQLISEQMWHNNVQCSLYAARSGFAADNHAFYGGDDNFADAPGKWQGSDTPAYSLFGRWGTYRRAFSAHDYLMYNPDIANKKSIWVALATLPWRWDVTVTRAHLLEPWALTSTTGGSPNPVNPPLNITGSAWAGSPPTWKWADANLNFFVCP